MKNIRKEISEELYLKAKENNGYIPDSEMKNVFSSSELYGYGVYFQKVYRENGKFYISYQIGDTCD